MSCQQACIFYGCTGLIRAKKNLAPASAEVGLSGSLIRSQLCISQVFCSHSSTFNLITFKSTENVSDSFPRKAFGTESPL